MALQHARAAQKGAITTDPLGRLILVTIAMDIGYQGQDSYPSYRTIAQRVHCHYNTVAHWVGKLAEAGDLIVRKEGKFQYYNVPFLTDVEPPDCHNDKDNIYDNPPTDCDNPYDNHCDNPYDNLEKIVTALSQQVAELSQQVAIIVTALQTEKVTEVIEVIEEVVPPPADPTHDFARIVAAYENAIGLIGATSSQLLSDALDTYPADWIVDALAESVRNNVRRWSYAEAILKRWGIEGRGERSANGSGHTADWQQFLEWHAGRAAYKELPGRVQDKIRAIGGDGIKKEPAHFLRKRFEEATT